MEWNNKEEITSLRTKRKRNRKRNTAKTTGTRTLRSQRIAVFDMEWG